MKVGHLRWWSLPVMLGIAAGAAGMSRAAEINRIYCYDGGMDEQKNPTNDGYNSWAQGWVFWKMGVLDENGKPPVIRDGKLMQKDPKDPKKEIQVGTVLKDGDRVYGYANADGTVLAYNLDTVAKNREAGTLLDAWKKVAKGGSVFVFKHGSSGNGDGTGGIIALDGGRQYPGFAQAGSGDNGTGIISDQLPYSLPARDAGDKIMWYLYSCWSGTDPDGEGKRHISVVDSLKKVKGVSADSKGYNLKTNVAFGLGPRRANRKEWEAFIAFLKGKAEKAGFTRKAKDPKDPKKEISVPDYEAMISAKPFWQQYSYVEELLKESKIEPKAPFIFWLTYRLTSEKNDVGPGGEDESGTEQYYLPVRQLDYQGGVMVHQRNAYDQYVRLEVPEGALSGPTGIVMRAVHPGEAVVPLGELPATHYIQVERYDAVETGLTFGRAAKLTFSLKEGDIVTGVYELLPDGNLAAYPYTITPYGEVECEIYRDGTFVVMKAM